MPRILDYILKKTSPFRLVSDAQHVCLINAAKDDLLSLGILPGLQKLWTSFLELLDEALAGVAALGGDLAFAHLEIASDDENHFEVFLAGQEAAETPKRYLG